MPLQHKNLVTVGNVVYNHVHNWEGILIVDGARRQSTGGIFLTASLRKLVQQPEMIHGHISSLENILLSTVIDRIPPSCTHIQDAPSWVHNSR
jgi:hypothetical protein